MTRSLRRLATVAVACICFLMVIATYTSPATGVAALPFRRKKKAKYVKPFSWIPILQCAACDAMVTELSRRTYLESNRKHNRNRKSVTGVPYGKSDLVITDVSDNFCPVLRMFYRVVIRNETDINGNLSPYRWFKRFDGSGGPPPPPPKEYTKDEDMSVVPGQLEEFCQNFFDRFEDEIEEEIHNGAKQMPMYHRFCVKGLTYCEDGRRKDARDIEYYSWSHYERKKQWEAKRDQMIADGYDVDEDLEYDDFGVDPLEGL